MLAPPPPTQRIWPAPPPAHTGGAASRYGFPGLAQILSSPQDKGEDHSSTYSEEPVKLRKEPKQSTNDWKRKEPGRIKTEQGVGTPCQVQEVTTSFKHEQNGGIPVGIAVARQRIQQTNTPPPLTVLTCEERSTNQVTGWSAPPAHWQYHGGVEQSLPLQVPPLQITRDPLSGQVLILPSNTISEPLQRAVVWPTPGAPPPPLVLPQPQPVLLDRFVTLAPHHHHHHHQEKRRPHDTTSQTTTNTLHDHWGMRTMPRDAIDPSFHITSIQGGSGGGGGGLAVGLFPPPPPPQTPFLMMPFSHGGNNSLLLSTQLTEHHNLNTMVVTNHQLSAESALLSPMEVIASPVDTFGGGGMIQQLPPSVVISHTETNHSFVRSDINTAVYPQPPPQTPAPQQTHHPVPAPATEVVPPPQVVVKEEEAEHIEEPSEEEMVEDERKAVMDASNQTESPGEESEGEGAGTAVTVKVEDKGCTVQEEELEKRWAPEVERRAPEPELEGRGAPEPELEGRGAPEPELEGRGAPEPDLSGLELLSNSIAQFERSTTQVQEELHVTQPAVVEETAEEDEEWKKEAPLESADGGLGGLGLLCTVAERCLSEADVDVDEEEEVSKPQEVLTEVEAEEEEIEEGDAPEEELPEPAKLEEEGEELMESELPEEGSDTCSLRESLASEKTGEWYTTPETEGSSGENLKLKIRRRPGRPKKKSKKKRSGGRCSPPVLEPWSASPIPRLTSPPVLTPHKRKLSTSSQRAASASLESDDGSGAPPLLSPACSPSSSKKRKVGRPKKRGTSTPVQTETLVTRCVPSSKAIVGLLMASTRSPSPSLTPPPATTPPPNRVKPKLKAEAKVKEWCDDEEIDLSPVKENVDLLLNNSSWNKSKLSIKEEPSPLSSPQRKSKAPKSERKCKKEEKWSLSPSLPESPPLLPQATLRMDVPDCRLTEDQLKTLPCRIMNISEGQLYRGEVTSIIAPDIYEVHIPKERCRKPQILCRDQVLSLSVAEKLVPEEGWIEAGTRVCAFWSQQYSCFYPGRVVTTSETGPLLIDFDDGDNGTIQRSNVRYLPQDFPVVEQPPNPLKGKRKRNNSTASSDSQKNSYNQSTSDSSGDSEPTMNNIRFPLLPEEDNDEVGEEEESQSEKMTNMEKEEEEEFPVNNNEEEELEESEVAVNGDDLNGVEDDTYGDDDNDVGKMIKDFFQSEEEERAKERRGECGGNGRRRHHHHKSHRHKHKSGERVCKRRSRHKHKRKHKHQRSHSKHKHSSSLSLEGDPLKSLDPELTSSTLNLTNTKKVSNEPSPPMTLQESNTEPPPPENGAQDWSEEEGGEEGGFRRSRSTSVANNSRSKIAAFLPARHAMWTWRGAGHKRGRALGPRGKGLKVYYNAIQREGEIIHVGDCAVFVSTGRPDRPFIGHIEAFWQNHMKKNMMVKVSWFYHPEETIGCPDNLPFPGGLFKSPHTDQNDVQTISHKCEVVPLAEFKERTEKNPEFLAGIYENNETYYLAGHYRPSETRLDLEPGILQTKNEE